LFHVGDRAQGHEGAKEICRDLFDATAHVCAFFTDATDLAQKAKATLKQR
jgi:hypothetical protein